MEVFEPEGEVEFSGGDIAAGDEAEDSVLNFGRQFGEGVAGAGAGDRVEFVEPQLIVEGDGGRQRGGLSVGWAGGEGGVDLEGEAPGRGLEDVGGDGLQGGELGGAEILGDVDGTVVDKLLEAKARRGLGGTGWRNDVHRFRADGHDTTLLIMRHARLTFVYLFDAGNERKSSFCESVVLPQRWYIDLGSVAGCVDNRGIYCVSMRMEEVALSRRC